MAYKDIRIANFDMGLTDKVTERKNKQIDVNSNRDNIVYTELETAYKEEKEILRAGIRTLRTSKEVYQREAIRLERLWRDAKQTYPLLENID